MVMLIAMFSICCSGIVVVVVFPVYGFVVAVVVEGTMLKVSEYFKLNSGTDGVGIAGMGILDGKSTCCDVGV
jgi:hypothetical protein